MAPTAPPPILPLIADPHRWQLLAELARSDRRVSELTSLLGKPQNLVSYHLGELRRAGVVTARRSSADGRDVYYRADLVQCGEMLRSVGPALHPGLRVPPGRAGELHHLATGRPPVVLFLCTGNSARSQMAEALLEHRSEHHVAARSAGSQPKTLHPNAIQVMAERGIDIANHTTKALARFSRSRFDRVITLCDKVREVCPEFPGRPVTAHWSIADPTAEGGDDVESYAAFERVADELEGRIQLLIHELVPSPAERTSHGR